MMPIDQLGNDKGPLYAAASRIEAILDEAVLSGALTAAERRAFVLVERGVRIAAIKDGEFHHDLSEPMVAS